jgi:hypothetical protein
VRSGTQRGEVVRIPTDAPRVEAKRSGASRIPWTGDEVSSRRAFTSGCAEKHATTNCCQCLCASYVVTELTPSHRPSCAFNWLRQAVADIRLSKLPSILSGLTDVGAVKKSSS